MARPGFLEHLHPPRLPAERVAFTHTFCLGGLSFLLFLVLAGSGLVLMFVYTPTPQGAANFFLLEAGDLPYAWFFRRIHYLAGQAMVVCALLHLARVLASGAYLPPRALNWLVGLALFGAHPGPGPFRLCAALGPAHSGRSHRGGQPGRIHPLPGAFAQAPAPGRGLPGPGQLAALLCAPLPGPARPHPGHLPLPLLAHPPRRPPHGGGCRKREEGRGKREEGRGKREELGGNPFFVDKKGFPPSDPPSSKKL